MQIYCYNILGRSNRQTDSQFRPFIDEYFIYFIYLLNSLKSINNHSYDIIVIYDFNNNIEKKVLIQQDLVGHERLY